MCGIAGIVSQTPLDPSHRMILREMSRRLEHRGPDGSGEYVDDRALLAHRRLSIIDIETGRQPIPNEDGTIHTVVNGEFYNFLELRESLIQRGHTFRTTGDSECIVHLYEEFGERCVEHLNGMFAFAIWDAQRRKLLLGRDRLGVKPLYYAVVGDLIGFASELKSLLALPEIDRSIDMAALYDYLVFDFVPSPRTILSNIRKLPPASMLVLENGRAAISSYWDLHAGSPHAGDADDIACGLWDELKRATRSRLVADVPVGALLSGGIDSGAVAGAMGQLSRDRIVTVTSGFEEAGFDERRAARDSAEQIGTRHFDHLVQADAAGMIDRLAWHFDEPFADPSAIPMFLLSQAARRHVTVALSGDGGDEVLAGYRRYRYDLYEEAIRRRIPGALRRAIFGTLSAVYPRSSRLPRFLRAGATLRNLATDGISAHGESIAGLSPQAARALLNRDAAASIRDHDPFDRLRLLARRCDADSHLAKCQYIDIKLGLADGILTKVDRASMAHGLEVRSPMLDYRFVEFAWRIPPAMRIRGRVGKALLRRAVTRELGSSIACRPKAGFDVPLDAWIRGPLRDRVESKLLDSNSAVHQWIAPGAIRSVWKRHMAGAANLGPLMWKLLMLDAWTRIHSGTAMTHPATTASNRPKPPERGRLSQSRVVLLPMGDSCGPTGEDSL
ncbi:MAG: asparagine synthase (glutamine-hydrolyzing) [Phycisphaerae bacterium]|nr:asparagine synthase (glutamine-hydrolyzing) [Phycisphaerae bacterium]